MGALITTIIAGILFAKDIIGPNTFMIYFFAMIIWAYAGAALYFKFGFLKFWYHDVLGWHTPDEKSPVWSDGCSDHATCKYCKNDIMQDSQGNWFRCK